VLFVREMLRRTTTQRVDDEVTMDQRVARDDPR
jgi:hypothetical protein